MHKLYTHNAYLFKGSSIFYRTRVSFEVRLMVFRGIIKCSDHFQNAYICKFRYIQVYKKGCEDQFHAYFVCLIDYTSIKFNESGCIQKVPFNRLHSLGCIHLVVLTWLHSLNFIHLVPFMQFHTCGSIHLIQTTSINLVVFSWLY